MDVDTTLDKIRELTRKVLLDEQDFEDAGDLAELFEALDSWIMSGGYLPESWRTANNG